MFNSSGPIVWGLTMRGWRGALMSLVLLAGIDVIPVQAVDFGVVVLRGGGTKDFWVYNIRHARWENLPSAPHSVGPGGSISFFHTDGCVYVMRGSGTRDFWRFTPTPGFLGRGGTWTTLAPTPAPVGPGGGLVCINFGANAADGGLYALQAAGRRRLGTISRVPTVGPCSAISRSPWGLVVQSPPATWAW